MKYVSMLVSVVIAAAVLLAAYAVGLLIRHGRATTEPSVAQAVSAPDEAISPRAEPTDQPTPTPPSPRIEHAEPKAANEPTTAKPEGAGHLTEKREPPFRPGGRGKRRWQEAPGTDRKAVAERLKDMTDEEKRAYRKEFEAKLRSRQQRRRETTSAVSGDPGDAVDRDTRKEDPGPNGTGQR